MAGVVALVPNRYRLPGLASADSPPGSWVYAAGYSRSPGHCQFPTLL